MKPQETAPILATIAPAAAIAPPVVIIGSVIGLGLLWLLADGQENDPPEAKAAGGSTPGRKRTVTGRRITRDDLAEALAYGERPFTRKEAVVGLETLGFRKSSVYKALAPAGNFASMIEFMPDGLLEWRG